MKKFIEVSGTVVMLDDVLAVSSLTDALNCPSFYVSYKTGDRTIMFRGLKEGQVLPQANLSGNMQMVWSITPINILREDVLSIITSD